ncbi:alanine--tRNA ligase [Alicyclobacillus tolerans]|uniref:alanine--tRNA ligase n=1 Tax=Alicyclobacillus tolerans TaxID=90970 RepID=UPI003B7D66CE
MKPLSGQTIRQMYKQFFAERGHQVMPSASLVPYDDPTLLWINAGMAPLKPYFDGREIPENPRIVSSQKCIRTNDIEEVGKTARHQTFFEMLGNFSFGDYFKTEAITWAWEFLTQHLDLDPQLLSVTIHVEDEEAFSVWHETVGLPTERIYRGEEDNFWEIGEGPCGPCSEIFYDRGKEFGCGSPDCKPGCDCDRFLEIWNLVFTQYNKESDGSYTPLPKKNIDTGSGLERLASVLQQVPNNFETDLFKPLLDATSKIANRVYGSDHAADVHFKIIADHVRTVSFAIADGVLPGNEGRSYIIRRLLRRAVRSGRRLGVERPFLYQLANVVADIMGEDYPEVRDKLDFIIRVIRTEEERFLETLSEGEALLADKVKQLETSGETELPGEDAFMLYDTFGFPIDLTIEIAAERGITVNRAAFEALLEEQRERARNARQQTEGMQSERTEIEQITEASQFVGYQTLRAEGSVFALLANGRRVERLEAGMEGLLFLSVTPFYAESGGQVADEGTITTTTGAAQVVAVAKAPHGQHVHTVRVLTGSLQIGQLAIAQVDEERRRETVKNHTATHLLHKALRRVLGTHVAQAGSLVAPDRLRFDFSHFGAMTAEEIEMVQDLVNRDIQADGMVHIEEMDIEAAKAKGAMALFGEKYGQRVRVVSALDSIELCGGCHVARTGLIGQFIILNESGIGSGVRRIEAVTGKAAYEEFKRQSNQLDYIASLLKAGRHELVDRVSRMLEEKRKDERELESLRAKLSQNQAQDLLAVVKQVAGVPLLAAAVENSDGEALRQMVDSLKEKMDSYVIVLASAQGADKVHWVAAVSKDLQTQGVHAGKLVKSVAQITEGSGGGRPDFAQAGGKNASKISTALSKVSSILEEMKGIRA